MAPPRSEPGATTALPPPGHFPVALGEVSATSSSSLRGDLLVVVRYPVGPASAPLVVFCHGLGDLHDGYGELLDHWASLGLVVAVPQFADSWRSVATASPELGLDASDTSLAWLSDPPVRAHFRGLLYDPRHWESRVRDVTSVLEQASAIAAAAGFAGELAGSAVAGHSYGAFTAQLLAGVTVEMPGEAVRSYLDDRLSCAVLLSPQGSGERGLTERSWDACRIPTIVVVGELDVAPGGQGPEWRREAYERPPAGGRFFLLVPGSDHGLGSIAGAGRGYFRDDAANVAAVAEATGRFLLAYVAGDEDAGDWLRSRGRADGPPRVEHR